jgi:hypothetical protein
LKQDKLGYFRCAIIGVAIVVIWPCFFSTSPASDTNHDYDHGPMLYSFKLGTTLTNSSSLLYEYWHYALLLEGGIRLPYCVICDYTDFWLYGSYQRFPFKKGSRFPIDSFGQKSVVRLTGDPFYTYSVFAGIRVSFQQRGKMVIPYLFYGYGYVVCSDLVLESESPLFPGLRTEYDNSLGGFLTFGLDYGLSRRIRILFELSASVYSEQGYLSSKLGVSLR